MKFLQSRFEDYISANEKYNLHSELEGIYNNKEQGLQQKRNLIFYGPSGVGKYTQVLKYTLMGMYKYFKLSIYFYINIYL